ncbi:hypothetical protein D0Z08_19360 [Nocardioides immobilis]|uniref:Uncharacterized protein n=1 Tax=Nocardioides immobilis TaxID=2049295 RepID=A0A417XYD9_9ACTN|nr:hypothetical protein [Nocardioides immobilis]RHW25388.1 hypothetical protein D0Z08_19360 [Nocardioides immobilis]
MVTLQAIYFEPPLAIARLGGAPTPMDNYVWVEDPTIYGVARNVLDPALTFQVLEDGSLLPFVPSVLTFREEGLLKPVAPFFEVHASVVLGADDPEVTQGGQEAGSVVDTALSLDLLKRLGADLSAMSFGVHVANLKAARRTNDPANGFEAYVKVAGTDHAKHPLHAFTPPQPAGEPLVEEGSPVPLGSFQIIRPTPVHVSGADLGTVRVRFTPARGEVYGPPTAVLGQDDATKQFHEIVPEPNRILNPRSTWLSYDGAYENPLWVNPEPWDTYDGADQHSNVSWGVVDDTCDGLITAAVVIGTKRYTASARISVGPPDYAPDRRPFVSLADDLADRDLEPSSLSALLTEAQAPDTQSRLADIFARVWETASLINLDAIRARALAQNKGTITPGAPDSEPPHSEPPHVGKKSMLPDDAPFADANVQAAFPRGVPDPEVGLVFSSLVALAHNPLADEEELIRFLIGRGDRVRDLVRPAYGAFADLRPEVASDDAPDPTFRDPRILRDLLHDMRMPPYMRDEMAQALGLTRRQYAELMTYVAAADAASAAGAGSAPEGARALAAEAAPGWKAFAEFEAPAAFETPARRRIRARLRRMAAAADNSEPQQ